MNLRKLFIAFLFSLMLLTSGSAGAQCSICTRTAQQQGERPARALNAGILYLAFIPIGIFGWIGYKWWKTNRFTE